MSYRRNYLNQINTHIPTYNTNNKIYLSNNYYGNKNIYYPEIEDFDPNYPISDDEFVNDSINEINDYPNYPLSNQIDNNNYLMFQNDVIDDFKNTLKQSQALTYKIRNHYKLINRNKNHQNYPFIPSIDNNNKIQKDNFFYDNTIDTYTGTLDNNLDDNYNDSYDDSNLINYENIEDYNNYQFDNINNYSNLPINETEKLKKINEKLTNSNLNLDELNKKLQNAVTNYKLKAETKNSNKNTQKFPFNDYDNILKQFIEGVKKSLQNSIKENLQLNKIIISTTNQMSTIYNNINIVNNKYKNYNQELNTYDDKINDINQYNTENKNKYENLKEEQNELNKMLEKLKIEKFDLKSKENILSMRNESNLKSRQDNEDLVLKLYSTINHLNEEQTNTNQKVINNTMQLKNDKQTLNIFDKKILALQKILENLENEKKIMNNLKNNTKKSDNPEKNVNLKMELNALKIENQKIQKNVNEEEKKIKELNGIIDNLTTALKNKTLEKELEKYDLNKIINDENENYNNKKTEIKIKIDEDENKIDNEIEQVLNDITIKNAEIENIKKLYDEIISKKDKRIEQLEKQCNENENMKMPEVNDIITGNNDYNGIDYGDYGKVGNSYNENVENKNNIEKNNEDVANYSDQQEVIPKSENDDDYFDVLYHGDEEKEKDQSNNDIKSEGKNKGYYSS